MKADHLSIGLVGKPSLSSDVYDHDTLLPLHDVANACEVVAVDVVGRYKESE